MTEQLPEAVEAMIAGLEAVSSKYGEQVAPRLRAAIARLRDETWNEAIGDAENCAHKARHFREHQLELPPGGVSDRSRDLVSAKRDEADHIAKSIAKLKRPVTP